jgi:hypothetical protein
VQQIFVVSTKSRRAIGPIQLPVQWVMGHVTARVKRPGHASTATAKVKNMCIYTSTAPNALMSRRGTLPYPYTLLLQWAGHFCRMHCSLWLIVLPQYYIQHSLNNPALRIKKHRSLIEAVLMSFGSIISFPKTSYLCRANALHRQTICCTVCLHSAASADWISVAQVNSKQVPPCRSMHCINCGYHS